MPNWYLKISRRQALPSLCVYGAGRRYAFHCPEQRTCRVVYLEIMRAFVKLRQILLSDTEFARRLEELESKYDRQFKIVFDAIRHLRATPVRDRKQIGFRSQSEEGPE